MAAPIRQRKTIIDVITAIGVVVVIVVGIVFYSANKPLSNGMSKEEGDQALESGISFFESGNYEEALRCFNLLPLDSKQYEEAQPMLLKSSDAYCNEIAEKAKKYVQNEEYEIALELLDNAQALLPNAAELKELYNTTSVAYRTFISTTAIESAEMHISNDDYEAAINVLRDAISKIGEDIEIETLLSRYEEMYCDNVIQQATAALQDEGYESAIAVANTGLNILPNSTSLQNAIEAFKTYKPVFFGDLPEISSGHCNLYEKYNDPIGNVYSNVYVGYCNDTFGGGVFGNAFASGFIETYTAGNYDLLTGIIIPTENVPSDAYGELKVYADDNLLYTSPSFTRKSFAENFEVNITGAQYIKIVFWSDSENLSYDDYPIMVDELMVQKIVQ